VTILGQSNRKLSSTGNLFYSNSTENINFLQNKNIRHTFKKFFYLELALINTREGAHFKKKKDANRWLMPIILVFNEAKLRRIKFEASLGKQFARPYFQNNQSKMDWSGSSGRVPAL
jgi:hypothetical protein